MTVAVNTGRKLKQKKKKFAALDANLHFCSLASFVGSSDQFRYEYREHEGVIHVT